jgi:hypothetical protein
LPEATFKIGETFPADDPVARFVTVLAMISNDWQRLAQRMIDLDDLNPADASATAETEALLIENYRFQASLHYEAAQFLILARKNFHQVDTFIKSLPAEALDEYERVVGGITKGSPHHHGRWLHDARNATFHYSKLNRQQPVGKALAAVADESGVIEAGSNFGRARFGFADKVALEWVGGSSPAVELAAQLTSLRGSVVAMTQFAQRAIRAYLEDHGITFTP